MAKKSDLKRTRKLIKGMAIPSRPTVMLEAIKAQNTFAPDLQAVADISLHLTPKTLASELAKLEREVRVLIYHFKPPYVDELRNELAATELPCPIEELEQDRTYEF